MVFETYVSTNIRLQTYVYTNQVCEVSGNISDHVLVFRVFDIYIDDMYEYDIYIYIYISILLDRFQKSLTRFLYVLNIKSSLLSPNGEILYIDSSLKLTQGSFCIWVFSHTLA